MQEGVEHPDYVWDLSPYAPPKGGRQILPGPAGAPLAPRRPDDSRSSAGDERARTLAADDQYLPTSLSVETAGGGGGLGWSNQRQTIINAAVNMMTWRSSSSAATGCTEVRPKKRIKASGTDCSWPAKADCEYSNRNSRSEGGQDGKSATPYSRFHLRGTGKQS